MITIGKPYVEYTESSAILHNDIIIDDKVVDLWFMVDVDCGRFLCDERDDAYLIAILRFAMLNGQDIRCEAPLTEELFYNIQEILIPALSNSDANLSSICIYGDIATDELPKGNAVGTGISCGVDSFHVLAGNSNLPYNKHNVTHLAFNNVGSHGIGSKAHELYLKRKERALRFAQEHNFFFVGSDSNIAEVIPQPHYLSHTYSSVFAVYCLQKLYSIYYYASEGYRFDDFSVRDSSKDNPGKYALLSLPLLSIAQLRLYSEGEGLTRIQKLQKVAKYNPSYKYLDVCVEHSENCGKCEKCVRTILGLDMLGALDNYKAVFDVEYYRGHQRDYMMQLLYWHRKKKHYYEEIYSHFKDQITLSLRIESYLLMIVDYLWHRFQKILIILIPEKIMCSIKNKYKKFQGFEY